jgi:hypothetical protein
MLLGEDHFSGAFQVDKKQERALIGETDLLEQAQYLR